MMNFLIDIDNYNIEKETNEELSGIRIEQNHN